MNIELKRIDYSARQSEETECFVADLYIDGKKVGEAKNEGHGGPTHYSGYTTEGRDLIAKAEDYCKSLPAEKHNVGDEEFTFPMTLELFIDNLLEAHLKQKHILNFQKGIEKNAKKNILISDDPESKYGSWSLKSPIATMLATPEGIAALTNFINKKVLPDMTQEEKILNRNIPEELLKNAGLKEHQYLKPMPQAISQKRSLAKKLQRKI